MSAKDFGGGYRRIAQYFWDPEPKNDDPSKPPIWCLGKCYVPASAASSSTSDTDNQILGESKLPGTRPEISAGVPDSQQAGLVKADEKLPSRPHETQEDDKGWPTEFLDDFEALAQSSVSSEIKVYINGDGADVYEDRFLSLATAEDGGFTPTLILVGIRLGIDRITPVYWEALKTSLQLPQSVGIAGGRPSSSHYFVGVQGDNFFFLDPHQTRPALPWRENVIDYSNEDVDSCHTRRLRRLPIHDMDPSMLIGFLIRNKEDWGLWRRSVSEVQGKPVVHIADKEPVMDGQEAHRQSTVYDVETLDEDEDDEGDGELV
ncbi:MAG: hypothetical protein LQ345_001277 [Seirophora villosa]|nr:MAG: hypothetical protein LQ345_001277 [Seirophora villosa]